MNDQYQEVYFDKYCETCKYKDVEEKDDPCFGCLANPVNLYSHMPVNYKEKEKKDSSRVDA